MANIQSQIKRNRQNEKRRLRNRDFRGSARTAVKDAFAAMTTGQDPKAAVNAAIRALDKAAQKGAIHPRNAARRKSRLIKRLASAASTPMAAQTAPEAMATEAPKATKRAAPAAESKAKPEVKKAAPKTAAKKAPAKKTTKK